MPSHKLAQLKLGSLELQGYSVAGEETAIILPRLDVCFDIGKAPEQAVPINHLLLSHGHIDHCSGLAYYLSHRAFCNIKPATVLLPENIVAPVRKMLDCWGEIDGNRIDANLIGVKPGDVCQIKPNLIAKVFETKHCYGSVGYTLIETRKKLKDEYLGLPAKKLVELKKQGKEIDYPLDIPLVTYLGDTHYMDFSQLDYVANSQVMIAECTFFTDEHNDRAKAGKHIHIDQLAKLLEKMNNDHILLIHLTLRTGLKEMRKILKKQLPSEIYNKVTILMDRRNFSS